MAEFAWCVEEERALSGSVLGCSVEKLFQAPGSPCGIRIPRRPCVYSASDLHIPFQNTTPWRLRPVEV